MENCGKAGIASSDWEVFGEQFGESGDHREELGRDGDGRGRNFDCDSVDYRFSVSSLMSLDMLIEHTRYCFFSFILTHKLV